MPATDTLSHARRLEAAGMPVRQAETVASILHETLIAQLSRGDLDGALQLAGAKTDARFDGVDADIRQFRTEVDARFDAVDARFNAVDADIRQLRTETEGRFRLLQWMLASLGAGVATVIAGVAAVLLKLYA